MSFVPGLGLFQTHSCTVMFAPAPFISSDLYMSFFCRKNCQTYFSTMYSVRKWRLLYFSPWRELTFIQTSTGTGKATNTQNQTWVTKQSQSHEGTTSFHFSLTKKLTFFMRWVESDGEEMRLTGLEWSEQILPEDK